jgi:hypothetical protein
MTAGPSTFIQHSADKVLNRAHLVNSIVAGIEVIGKSGIPHLSPTTL